LAPVIIAQLQLSTQESLNEGRVGNLRHHLASREGRPYPTKHPKITMATVSTVQLPQQQTIFQKLAMGAMMGTGVGLAIGFIGASVQILR
jgi:hypothetical protein